MFDLDEKIWKCKSNGLGKEERKDVKKKVIGFWDDGVKLQKLAFETLGKLRQDSLRKVVSF